ncbi:hypothetical protein BURK1_00553 [Burkholderiales bacterium]|nr:hypothetical protein BURK1_00553 [Burkholderiales bacterium]
MNTTRLVRAAALLGFLSIAGASAAQDIIFFEYADFNGRRVSASNSVSDLANSGFNDRASSMVVRSGTWQVCTESYFRGRCVTLNPGEYRNLGQIGLANQISSARQVGGQGGGWAGGGGSGYPQAGATLYEGFNFGGASFGVEGDVPNLGRTNFNDRARSLVVQGGSWQLCRDDDYRGGCQTFGPGQHGNLGFLAGEVSSIRPLGGVAGPGAGGGDWQSGWGSRSRVVLYEGANLAGRRHVLTEDIVPNFANQGFNDRASSLRVERGYWMFCSEADFRGTCRTFGPGDYPTLPTGLNNRISSGRRISDDYPYRSNPNWSGYTQQ